MNNPSDVSFNRSRMIAYFGSNTTWECPAAFILLLLMGSSSTKPAMRGLSLNNFISLSHSTIWFQLEMVRVA
jgi:hypothetical protein